MLIEKKEPFKKEDIVSFKLVTGEEIIAKIFSVNVPTIHSIVVTKPHILVMSQQGCMMVPFMFSISEDEKITFDNDKIIAIAKASKQFEDGYRKQTSSIVTARPGDLSGLIK